jgi:NTE family protein
MKAVDRMAQILRPAAHETMGETGHPEPMASRRQVQLCCDFPERAPVSRLEQFLSGVPILASLTPEHVAKLAARTTASEYRAGDLILRAGERNRSLHLLESGRLAVQVTRGGSIETVAHLHPGAPFGELSFITGRTCSADVRAVADATVVSVSESALNELPDARHHVLEMLAMTMAERLHASVSQRAAPAQARVVLLHQHAGWDAPLAFAAELARSLARQVEWSVLRVEVEAAASQAPAPDRDGVSVAHVSSLQGPDAFVAELTAQLPLWRQRFACILLNITADLTAYADALVPLCDWNGYLLGPSDRLHQEISPREFVVQDSIGTTLLRLSCREQLIPDVARAEEAHASRQEVSPRFIRTVDSIARCIAQVQVGLALGGGGAWAWSHIGSIRVLQRAGVPIDAIAGCSMGSVVGALLAIGYDTAALEDAALEWRRRFWTVLEYRFWRMHLARVTGVAGMLRERFADRLVNQTDIPFWPNALDVEAVEEIALSDGDIVSALMASMSLPMWLPPTSRNSRLLIDGVFVDPVPVSLTRRMHCHFNIALNAIGPFKARALPTRFPFRAYDLVSRCLRIVGHKIGQSQIEAGADAILVPDLPPETSMLSFDRYKDIIAAGEREAEARLASIRATYGELRRAATSAGAAVATS